jgi:hypothetical protein
MRKLFFLTACIFGTILINAQQYSIEDLNQSVFLYPEFYNGKILFKDKSERKAALNYNTLFQQMIYVRDGGMLALDNIVTIDTVYINTVKFVQVDTFFCEVRLVGSPLSLFIKYEVEIADAAPATPYGGSSRTGAVQSISSYRWSPATPYQLKVPENYNVRKFISCYIRSNNQLLQIKDAKQIKQLYPANEKQLSLFIREHHIAFDKTTDMEKPVSFIGTLNN